MPVCPHTGFYMGAPLTFNGLKEEVSNFDKN